ncbi:subunit beta of AP-1 complex [Chloropicon primus]|uniref:Beta-adaptin-like protein n=1 Tax=Chloropicon primus TaxID=1764295 RepID=A0A5B8MNG7_9CHLO|nr:subunit beta of AP-1 complex [Chloropicon primus]UPR01061.1 subunit beta of AP-1 complex [Chloropicon primus]|eukprot:QDZ21841.1 subunit beta of AP-1 complex [Chloropicon primus]
MAPTVDREHKGELQELKADLYDEKRTKSALKRMVAHASLAGTPLGAPNVSVLLPDVMHCLESPDVEMKKAVYMFLSALAAHNADAVTMAFNRMVRDVSSPNPLVRAIALRTLTSTRVEHMAGEMVEPVRVGLHDADPFVRKTAALSVAKVFDVSPEVVESGNLISELTELLGDANPHVVANAATALNEIRQRAPFSVLKLDMAAATKILAALNECTQWNQVALLDTLILFSPRSEKEAVTLLERVVPRLNHSNASVVMSAVKLMLYNLSFLRSEDTKKSFALKMAQPLCTLMSLPSDIQWTCLRNLKIILQKYPDVLATADVKTFFCKYNDPTFVKSEKVDIMIAMANSENVHQILSEFKEYCHDVDGEIARKAMQAVALCAINFESSVEFCIKIVLGVIEDKVPIVLQEAVVTVQTIFRKYPNRYESIISEVCSSLEEVDEPGAKAAIIWIIGEYSDRIEAAEEILEIFFETYKEEESQVQLALLTALSKLYLNIESDRSVDMLQELLGQTNDSVDDPDVRERALFYWRLLAGDLSVAREVVLAPKPPIESGDIIEGLDKQVEHILSKRIPFVSSVLLKRPSDFVTYRNLYACGKEFVDTGELEAELGADGGVESAAAETGNGVEAQGEAPKQDPAPVDLLGDLLSLDVPVPGQPQPTQVPMAAQVFPSSFSPVPEPTKAGFPSPLAQGFPDPAFQSPTQGFTQGFGQPQQAFPPQPSQSNNPFFD